MGGGDGEEESEEMTTASAGFGRRRFDVGCVGRTNGCLSFSIICGSSSWNSVSSMSSQFLFGIAPGKWGLLEEWSPCCVAAVALSAVGFWVELKLNLGAGVNC